MVDFILAAITSAAFVSVIGFICRDAIANFFGERIKYKFQSELEHMKSELRRRESEINELRSGALTAYWSRRSSADERTIKALEKIWIHIVNLRSGTLSVMTADMFDLKKFSEIAEKDEKIGRVFDQVLKHDEKGLIGSPEIHFERPFVPEKAWALFQAYHAIVVDGSVKMQMAGIGVNPENYVDLTMREKTAKAVLGEDLETYSTGGSIDYQKVLGKLEQEFLIEVRKWLSGEVESATEIAHARQIQRDISSGQGSERQ